MLEHCLCRSSIARVAADGGSFMRRHRIDYRAGSYEQSDLERKRRLRDIDVRQFMVYWMGGKVAGWIGEQFRSCTGKPLSTAMVRSHARRLQDQGLIPPPHGYAQPHWRDALGHVPDGPPEVNAYGRVVQRWKTATGEPAPAMVNIRPNNAGRPPKYLEGIAPAADQMEGLSWREKKALREARERGEQGARGGKDDQES